jgi:ankyrin repeat protein
MERLNQILIDFELHSVEGIRQRFRDGIDPNQIVKGKPLIYELINMYSRGPAFKECIRAFVEAGVQFDDPALLAVLLDDAAALDAILAKDKSPLIKTYSLDCTFTPLYQASLLHVCAEYNHLSCAKTLVKYGADANAKAGADEYGFGGHTPIFHTVNQHNNLCLEMLQYLLSLGVNLDITVKGLIWGKGYDWETFVPAVNPISYAMMGLLRQFQRNEKQIYEVVALLFKSHYGMEYYPPNIPNKYLSK